MKTHTTTFNNKSATFRESIGFDPTIQKNIVFKLDTEQFMNEINLVYGTDYKKLDEGSLPDDIVTSAFYYACACIQLKRDDSDLFFNEFFPQPLADEETHTKAWITLELEPEYVELRKTIRKALDALIQLNMDSDLHPMDESNPKD